MLLNVIVQNPAAESAIIWFDLVILAFLAVVVVGVWVFVARGRAGRDVDENASDRGLETLRRSRLVVRRSPKPRGPQAPVVSELEPEESEPTR